MRGQNVDAFLVIPDLRGPKLLDLLRMFGRIQHAPSIDTQLAVGKRNRGQFHAHAIKLGDESLNVKIQHFFPSNSRLERDFGEMNQYCTRHGTISAKLTPVQARSGNPLFPSIAVAAGSPLPACGDKFCGRVTGHIIPLIMACTLIR